MSILMALLSLLYFPAIIVVVVLFNIVTKNNTVGYWTEILISTGIGLVGLGVYAWLF